MGALVAGEGPRIVARWIVDSVLDTWFTPRVSIKCPLAIPVSGHTGLANN